MTTILYRHRTATADVFKTRRGKPVATCRRLNKFSFVAALVALCVSSVGFAPQAKAEYYGIAAINLRSFPTPSGNDPGTEFNFMLVQAAGRLVKGMHLPVAQQICEFFLLVRDNDPTNDAGAEFVRKKFTKNADPFLAPQVLARLKTRNARTSFRNLTTTNIRNPIIDDRFLYGVVLNLPTNNSIETVRIGVEVMPTCP